MCVVGRVIENEVYQAEVVVVVVMPVVTVVQKNDQRKWIGGVDVCVAAMMSNVSCSGERKWRRRGEVRGWLC